jgi:hypothetical protein
MAVNWGHDKVYDRVPPLLDGCEDHHVIVTEHGVVMRGLSWLKSSFQSCQFLKCELSHVKP